MKKNNIEIIICRYNEMDLNWINDYKNFVTLYNKGKNDIENIIPLKEIKYIPLKNIGKESHTYLYHIVNNYDNLAEYTFFMQADPIPHMHFTGSINILKELIKNLEEDFKLSEFYWISEAIGVIDIANIKNAKFAYEKIFNKKIFNTKVSFGQGAQFLVSKNLIHKKPLSFYKNILDMFELNPTGNISNDEIVFRLLCNSRDNQSFNPKNPDLGCYLELFWELIFNEI